jgi:hypothetical protein|tara:strand:+ start:518 stop:679 length:162 start_codon:yes stop_codon:yes gene_type:complete
MDLDQQLWVAVAVVPVALVQMHQVLMEHLVVKVSKYQQHSTTLPLHPEPLAVV